VIAILNARRHEQALRAMRTLQQERAALHAAFAVFCDLDQFKRINDTHGHAAGDEVLRVMGTRLARRLTAADVVARIGGDEFVVVAAGVQQHDAPGLLRRIEEAFASDPVRIGDLSLNVSCSLGLVCEPGRADAWPGSAAERVEELLSNADREMYAHKRSRAGVQRLLQLAESQPRYPRPDTDQR
jgi:diguanylate cyclase (GGDEF)-like protein